MISYTGEFTVPGDPDKVLSQFSDVKRMASCMPGASLEGPDDQGNYTGSIIVSFGPKKLRFTGTLTCAFDFPGRKGEIVGKGSGVARSSNVAVRAVFSVREKEHALVDEREQTVVTVRSEAEFGGILAEFAKAGGTAVANVLMNEFSRNAAAEFSCEDGQVRELADKPLSATSLVWRSIKGKFS